MESQNFASTLVLNNLLVPKGDSRGAKAIGGKADSRDTALPTPMPGGSEGLDPSLTGIYQVPRFTAAAGNPTGVGLTADDSHNLHAASLQHPAGIPVDHPGSAPLITLQPLLGLFSRIILMGLFGR